MILQSIALTITPQGHPLFFFVLFLEPVAYSSISSKVYITFFQDQQLPLLHSSLSYTWSDFSFGWNSQGAKPGSFFIYIYIRAVGLTWVIQSHFFHWAVQSHICGYGIVIAMFQLFVLWWSLSVLSTWKKSLFHSSSEKQNDIGILSFNLEGFIKLLTLSDLIWSHFIMKVEGGVCTNCNSWVAITKNAWYSCIPLQGCQATNSALPFLDKVGGPSGFILSITEEDHRIEQSKSCN